MTQIVAVGAPLQPDVRLGCGSPRAEVWTRGLDARVLELPEATAVSWSRVLADTSSAEATLAGQAVTDDPDCCEGLRDVRPWQHELVIYRDDALVWSGPITEIAMDGEQLAIKARDLSAWLDHRFVHETHIYGGQGVNEGDTDTTTIFTDLVTDAMAPDTSPNMVLDFGLVSGVLSQGNYTPASFKTVGPLIRDLAKGSIDWYVINRTLTYTGGGASAAGGGAGGGPPGAVDVTSSSIANPGFETNTTGWSVSGGGAAVTRDTGQFHAGVASGRIDYGTSPSVTISYASLTSLIVGKNYTLKAWFRTNGIAGANSDKMTVAGVSSSDFGYIIRASAPATWYQASVTFTATATTHAVSMRDSSGTTGAGTAHLWIDDLTLTLNNPDAPPPPPPPPPPPDTPVVPGSIVRLTDDDLAEAAQIVLSGVNQETRSIVTGQQSGGDVAFYGEAPQPAWTLNTTGPGLTTKQALYGLLESPTTSTLTDANGAQSQATQRSGLLADTPVIIGNFTLSARAGITMQQLVPGTEIVVQLDRSCISVQQSMLLRQVNVDASPDGEKITLVMEPTANVGV